LLKRHSRRLNKLKWKLLDKKSKLKVRRRLDNPRQELMQFVLRSLLLKLRKKDSTTRRETSPLPSNKNK
jgi:hypothetical protein